MILYALDTDTLSLFETQHPSVLARVLATPPDQLAITAITVREKIDGWYGLLARIKSPADEERVYQRLTDAVKICASVRVLPYTVAAIARYRTLHAAKLNVRPMDLRIAAVALEQGAIVVTRNRRDFERVPGLVVEDWSATPAEP
jgi:tRNA(fMet)-specific endonuclease VapC